MSETRPVSDSRVERILAYMVAATIGVSILAFVAVIIGSSVNAEVDGWAMTGVWPVVIMLPWFGLPLAFALLIALLITSTVRRRKEAAAATTAQADAERAAKSANRGQGGSSRKKNSPKRR
ncbi:hypothetical protein [Agromyces seonyuensis]|uniref:hypothetical protein n=1 Tax=Agromyces seonyuensis TaxID=2662446 RepID=UPI001924609A|nr:hypothetical protein [Agromyces seonyuensis]